MKNKPKKLSKKAQNLLAVLNSRKNSYRCIAHCKNRYVVIPNPNFNWDPRVQTMDVLHPECLPELVSKGLMISGEYSYSEYGTNDVYTLTEKGVMLGNEILANG